MLLVSLGGLAPTAILESASVRSGLLGIASGFAVVSFLWLVFFVRQVVSLPAELDREKSTAIDEQQAQRDRDARKRGLIEGIASLIREGGVIRRDFQEWGDAQLIKQRYKEWAPKATAYLEQEMDLAAATQFATAHGDGSGLHGRNDEGCGYWSEIDGKNKLLSRLIDELRRQ